MQDLDFPHYLYNSGVINDNQLEDIIETYETNEIPFGRIVLSKGILEKEQLLSLVKEYSTAYLK